MSITSPSPPPGLTRLGGTPPLREYLAQVWARREFARETAVGELRAQHMDTTLGALWHLLNPILQISIYYLIFGLILQVDRGVENFVGYLAVGVFVFHWSSKAITGGATAITGNEGLIRSLQFPRALLPISTVIKETLAFLPGVLVMIAVMLLTGEGLSVSWLLAPAAFVLGCLFCLGGAFVTARATHVFRDTQNLLPFVFRLVFYMSGVLYVVDSRFHGAFERAWVQWAFIANPFYALLSIWRDAFMSSQPISNLPLLWASAGIWAVGLLVVGLLLFRAGEKDYGRG
ncbi:ABC transporter permease [Egicoccus sp. AB-alg2]|uniref:ABC transporter permease n=1 Tax=Egicoccus sp. AB-alg2 TaxID=3242693 RepID=UPI00359EF0C0